MTELRRHLTFLLDLLAHEGPLTEHELQRIFAQLGEDTAHRMQRALHLLVDSGNILKRERPTLYFVAPASLKQLDRNPKSYVLMGHPAAKNVLRNFGKVTGPDERGVRRFTSELATEELERNISTFGISIRRVSREPD